MTQHLKQKLAAIMTGCAIVRSWISYYVLVSSRIPATERIPIAGMLPR